MKLNSRAFGLACGILWGGALLVVGLVNLVWSGYGQRFLEDVASFYPGYDATQSIVQVAIVTVYGFVDGLAGGMVFSWLYNRLAKAS
ncbi:MAG TPA: bacteriophage holin [Terracidiphilus sp.]|nr:bacteriophage holin [Terracidiphilus sp.]